MKNELFVRGGLSAIGFLMGCMVSVHAQCTMTDSAFRTSPRSVLRDDTHRLRFREVWIPAAVVGVSALCVDNGWLKARREEVQNVLSAGGKKKFRADDYIQYFPMAAVYGLNLSGPKGKHAFRDRTIILAMSYATMGILVNTMKFSFREKRPDSGSRNSFPSGHTATAFMGAEFLRREYRDVSPWIGCAGYAVAAATGYLRIYNDRHYLNDVVAGACIGIVSTKLAYWLYPKCFRKAACNDRIDVAGVPCYAAGTVGLGVSVLF